MCHRFTREGAKKVIVADLNGDGAKAVAGDIGSVGHAVDVSYEQTINLIEDTKRTSDRLILCSNAVLPSVSTSSSQTSCGTREVNTMSHIQHGIWCSALDRARRLTVKYCPAAVLSVWFCPVRGNYTRPWRWRSGCRSPMATGHRIGSLPTGGADCDDGRRTRGCWC